MRPKRRRGPLIAIVLLALALAAALAVLIFTLLRLDDATLRIGDQERQIEQQRELIEKKEIFGEAMDSLLETSRGFDGVLLASIVPIERYDELAAIAWAHRWDAAGLDRDTADVREAQSELETLLAGAVAEAATNASGTTNEAVIDSLGAGFVTSTLGDADTLCAADVLACVMSDDPRTVHFDAADSALPYMTDWLRTGLAYHEFAHVLQFTNPAPTEIALASFGGDTETMADCYALTYLDGWTLDHEVWVSSTRYWRVSIGYGHTCDERQRQAVRDWYGQLGFRSRAVSQ